MSVPLSRPPRAYMPWDEAEEEYLLEMLRSRKGSIREISYRLGRSERAVQIRACIIFDQGRIDFR